MKWNLFILLFFIYLMQAIIVGFFEHIYLFAGTSLRNFLFAVYYVLLTVSMFLITSDVPFLWKWAKEKFIGFSNKWKNRKIKN